MSIPTDHPFQPGVRVAIGDKYGNGYREGFVAKVHKNGNFVLRGSPQQWRAWSPSPYGVSKTWTAHATGDGSRPMLKLWDETTDKEILATISMSKRWLMYIALRKRIERLSKEDLTDEMLTQIEAALPPVKGAAA